MLGPLLQAYREATRETARIAAGQDEAIQREVGRKKRGEGEIRKRGEAEDESYIYIERERERIQIAEEISSGVPGPLDNRVRSIGASRAADGNEYSSSTTHPAIRSLTGSGRSPKNEKQYLIIGLSSPLLCHDWQTPQV